MGRHARQEGLWFNPLPWALGLATLLFVVVYLRHLPCLQTDAETGVDTFIRLCYTDIQASFISGGLASGESVFGGPVSFSPLTAVVVATTVWLTSAMGADIGPTSDLQAQLDAMPVFFGLTTVVLFGCFLAAVAAAVLLGRDSANAAPTGKRYRSWQALAIAASPIVLATGLIDWSLLPLALTMLGLLRFAQRRVVEAGLLLGLAAAAGTMPIAVLLAVGVAVGLRGTRAAILAFWASSAGIFLAVHVPLMLNQPSLVVDYYVGQIDRSSSDGSLLFLLEQVLGFESREIGALFFALRLLILGALVAWLYVTRRRPRVGSLVGLFVLVTVLLAPGFTPQTALWVLLAVSVARPFREELIVTAVSHTVYTAAIWGWLSGHLTAEKFGPAVLYYVALLSRVVVEAWLLVECLLDVARPARDRLRSPEISDPIGGMLIDGESLGPDRHVLAAPSKD